MVRRVLPPPPAGPPSLVMCTCPSSVDTEHLPLNIIIKEFLTVFLLKYLRTSWLLLILKRTSKLAPYHKNNRIKPLELALRNLSRLIQGQGKEKPP